MNTERRIFHDFFSWSILGIYFVVRLRRSWYLVWYLYCFFVLGSPVKDTYHKRFTVELIIHHQSICHMRLNRYWSKVNWHMTLWETSLVINQSKNQNRIFHKDKLHINYYIRECIDNMDQQFQHVKMKYHISQVNDHLNDERLIHSLQSNTRVLYTSISQTYFAYFCRQKYERDSVPATISVVSASAAKILDSKYRKRRSLYPKKTQSISWRWISTTFPLSIRRSYSEIRTQNFRFPDLAKTTSLQFDLKQTIQKRTAFSKKIPKFIFTF